MALMEFKKRYRRSTFGQFWFTLTTAITILGMGLVFSVLFKMDPKTYLLYLSTSIICWTLISSTIVELSTSFISNEGYLKNYPGPKSIVIYKIIFRNIIAFLHNLIILPVVFLICQKSVGTVNLLAIVGLFFLFINLVFIGLIIGPLCTRYRDGQQIIQSFMNIIVYVTPIFYTKEQIASKLPFLVTYNPFYYFIEIIRAPLLGTIPSLSNYIAISIITICLGLIGAFQFSNSRKKIIFWI
jgi:lipopolysaccharide transport system permease protein